MTDPTTTIVISSSIVSIIVSLAITLLTLIFTTGTYKQKIDSLEKNFEKWTDKIDTKIFNLLERLSKVEAGLDRDREHNKLVQSKSPLSLTDQGKVVLLDSHGKDYVDNNKAALIASIKQLSPRTAYDVQEFARQIIENNANTDGFIPIKNFAFSSGKKLKDIIEVLGIYLRDIALKELGFDISDIKD